jgi:hypothetical protein
MKKALSSVATSVEGMLLRLRPIETLLGEFVEKAKNLDDEINNVKQTLTALEQDAASVKNGMLCLQQHLFLSDENVKGKVDEILSRLDVISAAQEHRIARQKDAGYDLYAAQSGSQNEDDESGCDEDIEANTVKRVRLDCFETVAGTPTLAIE